MEKLRGRDGGWRTIQSGCYRRREQNWTFSDTVQ